MQEPDGEVEIGAGRTHRDCKGTSVDPDLERFLGGQQVSALRRGVAVDPDDARPRRRAGAQVVLGAEAGHSSRLASRQVGSMSQDRGS